MAKLRDEIVANAMRSWKQKDKSNVNWFKSIVEGAWNSGYKRGMDDAIEVEKAKHLWIPVTERLPEDEVLCINDRQFYLVGLLYCDDVGNYICETDGEIMYDVTHWMPLPQPPKEE